MSLNRKKVLLIFILFLPLLFSIIALSPEHPEINTSEMLFINATSISSNGLTPNSGNNVSLISEMNGGYWEGNETNSNPWQIDIVYNNVTYFDAIDFTSRYFSTSGTPSNHEVELLIFCITHNDYMEAKDYHNEADWYSRTYYYANSHHYILPNGTVYLRLRHLSNGVNAHRIRIDVSRLIINPKFRADTNIFNNYTNSTFNGTLVYGLSEFNLTNGLLYKYNNTFIIEHTPGGMFGVSTNLDMEGNDIVNCANCANTTQLNEKVNISGDTMTGYLNFADNKGITVTANTPAGGISQLVRFNMQTPYDRPWIDWHDETGRNRVAMGYHTLNAADNASHEDIEIKTSNETGTDMITRFTLGTNKLVVNATFTDIEQFLLRSTSSTIYTFDLPTVSLYMGNGTNTASKIDFSGSRGAFGYQGASMVVQSGANKPLEFHVNSSSFGSTTSTAMTIQPNQSVSINSLQGIGNALVCVYANGTLYRGNLTSC